MAGVVSPSPRSDRPSGCYAAVGRFLAGRSRAECHELVVDLAQQVFEDLSKDWRRLGEAAVVANPVGETCQSGARERGRVAQAGACRVGELGICE